MKIVRAWEDTPLLARKVGEISGNCKLAPGAFLVVQPTNDSELTIQAKPRYFYVYIRQDVCERQNQHETNGIRGPVNPRITMLGTKVLMLNRSFLPVHVTSVRRALNLLYLGIAKVVNEKYQTFDFESWRDLSVTFSDESIGLVNRSIRVPRVIVLVSFDRVPRRQVRFSRYNIYARDKCTCQYCGSRLPRRQLNLDHVIPRSRGGTSRWENIVCSCLSCNRKKGGKTPQEARMKLLRPPLKPKWTSLVQEGSGHVQYDEWLPFLSVADTSYWNVDLSEE